LLVDVRALEDGLEVHPVALDLRGASPVERGPSTLVGSRRLVTTAPTPSRDSNSTKRRRERASSHLSKTSPIIKSLWFHASIRSSNGPLKAENCMACVVMDHDDGVAATSS